MLPPPIILFGRDGFARCPVELLETFIHRRVREMVQIVRQNLVRETQNDIEKIGPGITRCQKDLDLGLLDNTPIAQA